METTMNKDQEQEIVGLKHTIKIHEEANEDWKNIVKNKNEEIDRLKENQGKQNHAIVKHLVKIGELEAQLKECKDKLKKTQMDNDELKQLLYEVVCIFRGWHSDGTTWSEYDESVLQRVIKYQFLLEGKPTEQPPFFLDEAFADNGEHSHWRLIDRKTGSNIWSEDPEEDAAVGFPVKAIEQPEAQKDRKELLSDLMKTDEEYGMYEPEAQKELRIGDDNICPISKEPCDDECCSPGAICNISGRASEIQNCEPEAPQQEQADLWNEALAYYDQQGIIRRGRKEISKELQEQFTITRKPL